MGEMVDARRRGGRAFVGRDREAAELTAGLEDAVGGRGRLLLVAAEPGIGKTWLVEHLAGLALQRGIGVLWALYYRLGVDGLFADNADTAVAVREKTFERALAGR